MLHNLQSKIEYSQLCDITSELVGCVNNNREKSRIALHFLTKWVSRLRLKDYWFPTFTNVGSITDNQVNDTMENTKEIGTPISAVFKNQSPNNCKKD